MDDGARHWMGLKYQSKRSGFSRSWPVACPKPSGNNCIGYLWYCASSGAMLIKLRQCMGEGNYRLPLRMLSLRPCNASRIESSS